MLTIGDALAFASICVVITIAIVRFSSNRDNVKEKECLLRTHSMCNKFKELRGNIEELFNQFNSLNRYLREKGK